MSVLRFRAWDGKNYFTPKSLRFNDRGDLICTDDGVDAYEAAIVEQSTGLHDEKGVEIFEGDILEIEAEDGEINRLVTRWGIARREMASGWECDIPCFFFEVLPAGFKAFPIVKKMLEVIGNYHENPELMYGAIDAYDPGTGSDLF